MPANITLLVQKYLSNSCSPQEVDELVQLLASPVHEQEIDNIIIQQLAKEYKPETQDNQELNQRLQKRLQEILRQPQQEAGSHESLVVSMKPRTQLWKRIAVAASIILVVSIGVYVISTKEKSQPTHDSPLTTHDVPAPDKNRAQIKLSDGQIIYLDSAANGELVTQSNVVVTKTADGKIIYAVIPTKEGSVANYNTLMNPRGSRVIDMTLADGSHVWLNAGSSITYPVAFTGSERKVSITGEAYFEIAKHHLPPALAGGKKGVRLPFIVSANNKADVTVLGTHFNVNSYDDEADIKVTLLEGSVQVSAKTQRSSFSAVKIKPGEQAVFTNDSRLTTTGSVDLNAVMAWKNGTFEFKSADIESIMRQVARWYDVEIVYEEKVNSKFNGKIPRTMSAMNVFKVLEETGGVHFKIEGKKVVVSK
jgi:transmembrane sensor